MQLFFNFIWLLLGLAVIALPFVEKVLLLPTQREQIQKQFERWWKTVTRYNTLKFAIACATKANDLLDRQFGTSLMSLRTLYRCFFISNGLLIVALSWVGFVDKEPFGVTPWRNFEQSVAAVKAIMDDIIFKSDATMFVVANMTNAPPYDVVTNELLSTPLPIEQSPNPVRMVTNTIVVRLGTNTVQVTFSGITHVSLQEIEPIGHGEIFVGYHRTFESGRTNGYTNSTEMMVDTLKPYVQLKNAAASVKQYVVDHDNRNDVIIYSAFYFIFMFLINAIMFTISLMGCRVMLREIVLAGRTLSTIGLVFTNLASSLFVSIALLMIFTVLASPLLWISVPAMYYVASESIYTFCIFLIGGAVTLWILSGTAAKIIALIALMPSIFAIGIGAFSTFAIKWKDTFHWTISAVLNRFVKNGAFPVMLGSVLFITALIVLLAKWLHLTAFL